MKKAFTLIELIVVITILAILSTIAFVSLDPETKKNNLKDKYEDFSYSEQKCLKKCDDLFFSIDMNEKCKLKCLE